MVLTTIFENNKEKELEFVFGKAEANEIILSFLQRNDLIDNKDKCQISYVDDGINNIYLLVIEEFIEAVKSNDIISNKINKIEFDLYINKKSLFNIFINYIRNNFKYIFNTSDTDSYSIDYYISDL